MAKQVEDASASALRHASLALDGSQLMPQDDLLDPFYRGNAQLVLVSVPSQCDPMDITTWLLFGITQELPPLVRLTSLLTKAFQTLQTLQDKLQSLPRVEFQGTPQQQSHIRENLTRALNAQMQQVQDEIKELERRCKRMTKLIMTEPVTLGVIPQDLELPLKSGRIQAETKTWTATLTSPRGRELASLALGKTDWSHVRLVQTRPHPRAFLEEEHLMNQSIDPDDLTKEINMRTVRLRRLRHGEGELVTRALRAQDREQHDAPLAPTDKRFHFSSISGVYFGAFHLGQKHGHGREYTNIGVYEGAYRHGTRCGDGKLVYGKGTTCQGKFERPRRHYEHNAKVRGRVYECSLMNGDEYRDGVESGEGMHLEFPDGAVYDGEMRDGVVSGLGRYTSSTGVVDEGMFVNGLLHGLACKRTFPDGSFVEGTFVQGQLHGHGHQRDRHGDEYHGFFDTGARHGRGIARFQGGRAMHVGFWYDDAMDGRGDFYYRLGDDLEGHERSEEELEEFDFWYEGAFLQNKTRARHRHVELRGPVKQQQELDQHLSRHLPFTTNGHSRESMPFLTTRLPTQLDKLRQRRQLNWKRRTERERTYLEQRELSNLTLYYALLDDFYEQWTEHKRQELNDTMLQGQELQRAQEERQALRALSERRLRFRKEKYNLSPRKKLLANFEQYLERVTLTELVQLERAEWNSSRASDRTQS